MKLTLNLGNMRSYAVAVVAGVLLLAGYSQKGEAAACDSTGTFQDLMDCPKLHDRRQDFQQFLFPWRSRG